MDFSRFRNYGLWLSIFAFIPMLLKAFGVDIIPANYDELVSAFLGILVLAGILSNPTTNVKWFLDDPKDDENPEENQEENK